MKFADLKQAAGNWGKIWTDGVELYIRDESSYPDLNLDYVWHVSSEILTDEYGNEWRKIHRGNWDKCVECQDRESVYETH
jgi:hypothetical protein